MMVLLRSKKIRWTVASGLLLAVMLAFPLLLFAWLSYVKLSFVSWSYYVPYEELRQGLASAEVRKIYYAPLLAVNVTSGFLIANMFTYTLGHTLVTLALVALMMACFALAVRRARARASRVSAAAASGAAACVSMTTAASSSAALTGCHGGGMGGGIIALSGLGSATGAWMSDAATWTQFLLVMGFAAALALASRKERRAVAARDAVRDLLLYARSTVCNGPASGEKDVRLE